MKGNLKKILSAILVTAMSVGMCVSASAAPIEPCALRNGLVGKKVVLIPKSNTGSQLNMYVSSMEGIENGKNVTTWNYVATDDTQYWIINRYNGSTDRYVISPFKNQKFALNYYTDGTENCTLYAISGNAEKDFVVSMVDESNGSLGDKYGIVLPERVKCLTVMTGEDVYEGGVAKGKNVRWKSPISSTSVDNTQAWNPDTRA